MNLSNRLNKFNIFNLVDICQNGDVTIEWCRQKGLLPISKNCPACKSYAKIDVPMTFQPQRKNVVGSYSCQNKKNHKNGKQCLISALSNTWFENTHLELQRALVMTFCFVKKMSYEFTVEQTTIPQISQSVTSPGTVCDWFSSCREVCMDALDNEYEEHGKIGGEGIIVEIDESKVSLLLCSRLYITVFIRR